MKESTRKIRRFFYDIKSFPIRSRESIKQLVAWFPIIWETRDWDYGYLLEIMEFKMNRMYDALTSDKAWGEIDVEYMWALKRCANILNMLQEDRWEEPAFEDHYEKFPMKSLEEMFEPYTDEQGRRCNIMKSMTKAESKSFGKAVKQAEKDHTKLLAEFSKLFSEYYRGWWD